MLKISHKTALKKAVFLLLSSIILTNLSAQSLNGSKVPGLENLVSGVTGPGTTGAGAGLVAPSSATDKARLAMTSDEYRVTAGDVYNLSFLAGNAPVSFSISVDSSYKIRVANLAVLNVSDTTFMSLKRQVEELVTKNYPMSGVQFNLVSPGTFKVVVKGEVNSTVEAEAWSLTRLSEIVNKYKNTYASIRDITIKSRGGRIRSYDLFKAQRFGDFSQDPYLRPGDVITLSPVDRRVTIKGAVKRPGTYDLLQGETLVDLVTLYGNGLAPTADVSRIEVTKVLGTENKTGKKDYLKSVDGKYKLNNYDTVFIPSFSDLKPVAFVEGAIITPEAQAAAAAATTNAAGTAGAPSALNQDSLDIDKSQHVPVRFEPGTNYASFVRKQSAMFTSVKADLENAYVIRGENRLPLNLSKILYDNSYYTDITVEPGDTLLVPFKQTYVVTVEGEVNKKGEVPAAALTRVSAIFGTVATEYSSRRSITIKSVDGKIKHCDLFKAQRQGDLTQDPYLKPGDIVTIGRIDRKVKIEGAVERPGTYELLPGENLPQLVEIYGHGLIPTADTTRIEITKLISTKSRTGEKIYLDNIDSTVTLDNYDTVYIHTTDDLNPLFFVEGAIGKDGAVGDVAAQIPVRFEEGLNYASFIRSHENWFNSLKSDIDNAYIVRKEQRIPIDIRTILYDRTVLSDLTVEKNDKLTVPYKQAYIVFIDGEVKNCGEVPINAYTRLSTVVNSAITTYSSIRTVKVTSTDGDVKICDLFKATRYGQVEQNPYLQPGDVITVGRLDRRVKIEGAVERPGTYELMADENLKELIHNYGHGLGPLADTSRIRIDRYLDTETKTGETLYLDNIDETFQLNCYDIVTIGSFEKLKPIVFVEGAIGAAGADTELKGSDRKSYRFTQGTNYATFIRAHEDIVNAKSDLRNAYIIRNGEKLPLDVAKILYDKSYHSDLVVEPYDTVMIPFKQLYVSVAGAVALPGRYPYIPDRTYEYYIGIAGGVIAEKNVGKAVEITDINGNKLNKDDIIMPETTITARANSFTYYFGKYAPVISTLLGIISTSISLGVVIQNSVK